ncbi:MAG TPA: hypothetical protein VLH84_06065 [Patescibacteria group bacterium]|nr:hypothetical protein [Patescibacteria group bacterium]
MKFTKVLSSFFELDQAHARVDLSMPTAGLVAIVVAVCWSANGATTAGDYGWRLLAALVFVGLALKLLLSAGASRVASLFTVALALALCSTFSLRGLWLVSIYAAVLAAVQEYFLTKGKLAAIAAVVITVGLLAGVGDNAKPVLLVFGLALVARVLWHAILERVSRRVFVLFTAKVLVLVVATPLFTYGVMHALPYSFGLPEVLGAPTVSVWVVVVVGLVVLRGLWATMLLRTERSPQFRGLRIFYTFLGVGLLAVVFLVHRYATSIFLPGALQQIYSFGLGDYGIAVSAYALLVTGLMLTAAIDRSLYTGTPAMHRVKQWLR